MNSTITIIKKLVNSYVYEFNKKPFSKKSYEKYYDLFDYVYYIYFSKVCYEGDIPDGLEPDDSVTHIDYDDLLNRVLEVIGDYINN
jgi:hypothetical protein